jgi:hypothetical protein
MNTSDTDFDSKEDSVPHNIPDDDKLIDFLSTNELFDYVKYHINYFKQYNYTLGHIDFAQLLIKNYKKVSNFTKINSEVEEIIESVKNIRETIDKKLDEFNIALQLVNMSSKLKYKRAQIAAKNTYDDEQYYVFVNKWVKFMNENQVFFESRGISEKLMKDISNDVKSLNVLFKKLDVRADKFIKQENEKKITFDCILKNVQFLYLLSNQPSSPVEQSTDKKHLFVTLGKILQEYPEQ